MTNNCQTQPQMDLASSNKNNHNNNNQNGSNSNIRHTACKSCRDRKVRCDGEQPSCAKCRRTGEECTYLPTQRPTRVELKRTIETLRRQLNEAEARISAMAGQTNGAAAGPAKVTTESSPASYGAYWHASTEGPPSTALECPFPPFFGPSGASASPSSPCNNINPTLLSGGRPVPDSLGLGPDVSPLHSTPERNNPILSSSGSRTAVFSSSATTMQDTAGAAPGTQTNDDDVSAAIAAHLGNFSSAVFNSQAEIAGIALAVAKYVAWMRKAPTGTTTPPNTSLVYVDVLDAIESRLGEMGEIAQTRPQAAFHEMLTRLQELGPAGSTVCNKLGDLELDFQKRSAEMAEFFQTRYNACILLREQAQNVPHGSLPTSSTQKE